MTEKLQNVQVTDIYKILHIKDVFISYTGENNSWIYKNDPRSKVYIHLSLNAVLLPE